MPTYLYSDGKHSQERTHGMLENPSVNCTICQAPMHRVPQVPRVNWNGLPPHEADRRPKHMQRFIDDAPNRRARYLAEKDK